MDRETAIRELEVRIISDTDKGYKTIEIPVNEAEDILALLKEQESVEPIPPMDESDMWRCGNCKHQIFRCKHQRFCEKCGKAVKWK